MRQIVYAVLRLRLLEIARESLDINEFVELIDAIISYHKTGEYSISSSKAEILFQVFKEDLDKSIAKAESTSNARRESGRKGGLAKSEQKTIETPPPTAEVQEDVLILEPDPPIPPKPKAIKKENTEGVRDLWNDICGETFGYVKTISLVRSQKIKARIKDFGDDYMARFEEIFNRLVNAPFCIEGAKKWCNFDWILANDNNYVKLLEGRYDHHSTDNGNRPLTKFELAQLSKQQAANAIANSCVADFEREREKESRVPIMQL